MYAWIVEVILRLVNPTKDGLIITFSGVRNKSSGIFHSKWKCKLLSTSGSKDSHGTHFVFTFSENLYLQHLNGWKWWVFIHLPHFGAHNPEVWSQQSLGTMQLNLLDDWLAEQFSTRLNLRPNLDFGTDEKKRRTPRNDQVLGPFPHIKFFDISSCSFHHPNLRTLAPSPEYGVGGNPFIDQHWGIAWKHSKGSSCWCLRSSTINF